MATRSHLPLQPHACRSTALRVRQHPALHLPDSDLPFRLNFARLAVLRLKDHAVRTRLVPLRHPVYHRSARRCIANIFNKRNGDCWNRSLNRLITSCMSACDRGERQQTGYPVGFVHNKQELALLNSSIALRILPTYIVTFWTPPSRFSIRFGN